MHRPLLIFLPAQLFGRGKFLLKFLLPIRNSLEDGRAAFHALRLAAKDNHLQDMSLDEINKEIRLARDSKE